jgi:hypothetical protein
VKSLITHSGKWFDDNQLRPYSFSKRIANNFYQDECEIFSVYGMPEGVGKSANVNHVLADLKGFECCKDKELLQYMYNKKPSKDTPVWEANYELIKPFVLYLPEDVVRKCKNMLLRQERDFAFHWDDAGTWLNAMSYQDPFVIAFMNYLSLARSNWGAVILSTPVEDWILKKLRTSAGVIHVKITKEGGNAHIWKPRLSTGYKAVKYLGTSKVYYPTQFIDRFVAIMPDKFYKWYKPKRDSYALISAKKMEKVLNKRRARGIDTHVDEAILESIKESIANANDETKDFQEVMSSLEPSVLN